MQIILSQYNLVVAASETIRGHCGPTSIAEGGLSKYSLRANSHICAAYEWMRSIPRNASLLEEAWRVILASVASAGITKVRWGTRSENQSRLALARLAKWMLTAGRHSGPGWVVALLKKAANEARRNVILGETGPLLRFLLRRLPKKMEANCNALAFIGRALPEGDDLVVSTSLKKHAAIVKTPYVTNPQTLESMYDYAKVFSYGTARPNIKRARWVRKGPALLRIFREWLSRYNRTETDRTVFAQNDNVLMTHLARSARYRVKWWKESGLVPDNVHFNIHVDGKTTTWVAYSRSIEALINALTRERVPFGPRPPFKEALTTSPSACVEAPRRLGGVRETLRKSVKTLLNGMPDHVRFRYAGGSQAAAKKAAPAVLRQKVPKVTRQTHRIGGFLNVITDDSPVDLVWGPPAVSRGAAVLTTPFLSHRVCAVRERGYKARIITVPPVCASVSGNTWNKELLSRFNDRRCIDSLRGNRVDAIRKVVDKYRPGYVFFSTDLTSASDCLPLDLVQSAVEGFLAGMDYIPPEWAEALRTLTGPQDFTYPDGTQVRSKRGIMMGLGPTWPILSLIHLFWTDLAASRLGAVERRAARYATAICGDDLLGCWPESLANEYVRVVESCGGEFSPLKTFKSPDAGVFTEITFTYRDGKLRFPRGVPLKGLVYSDADRIGEAYESFGFDNPGKLYAARRVIRALHPGIWRPKTRVPPNFLRVLGGVGLPPRKGNIYRWWAPFRHRLAAGRLLYGSGALTRPLGPPSWVTARDPALLFSFREAEAALERALASKMFEYAESTGSTPRVKDILARLCVRYDLVQVFGNSPIPPSVAGITSLQQYERALLRWIATSLSISLPTKLALSVGANTVSRLLSRYRKVMDIGLRFREVPAGLNRT